MRRLFLIIALLIIPMSIYAQEIETYYYNKEGKIVNQVFADFYRVISVPNESSPEKMFRDFYMSGKIKGEGHYLTIDKSDVNNSVLDGECVFYKESGSIDRKFSMSNGKYNGTYVEFSADGKEFIQIEYTDGNYTYDWYYKANTSGAYGRFKHDTHEPVYDKFNPQAQFTTWIDGIPWVSYTINGLTISMAIQQSNAYGRYHEVSLMVDNATFNDMIIEPSVEITAYASSTASTLSTEGIWREVLSYDAYMQKVKNRQAWATVAMAISSAAAGVSSALSPNSASVSVNGHTAFVNTYGNHVSIFSPDLAFAGVGEAWAADRNIIHKGYLKKNTVLSGQIISGYFNIKREYSDYLAVVYDFNGVKIPFYWNVSGGTAMPISYYETKPKAPEEVKLRQYGTDSYKWQAKHGISISSIKVKKKTKIELVDPGYQIKDNHFVIVDVNGEHSVSQYFYSGEWITLVLDSVDIQYPFSIICTENPELNFLKVEPVQ